MVNNNRREKTKQEIIIHKANFIHHVGIINGKKAVFCISAGLRYLSFKKKKRKMLVFLFLCTIG